VSDGKGSEGGRLTLGQRVHQLEHEQSKTRKEVKRVRAATGLGPDDEDVIAWVGKRVVLVPAVAGMGEETGVLKRVHRFTYLLETAAGLESFNKGQVLKMRLSG